MVASSNCKFLVVEKRVRVVEVTLFLTTLSAPLIYEIAFTYIMSLLLFAQWPNPLQNRFTQIGIGAQPMMKFLESRAETPFASQTRNLLLP